MQFEITSAARAYIHKKGGGVISIKLEKRQTGCGCCGATEVETPVVRLGAPLLETDQYQEMPSIDLILYVHSSLQNKSDLATLTIDVERTLFGRKLVLYGLTQE